MEFGWVFDRYENISIETYRQHFKKQRHDFANKGPSSQGYGFSTSHVWCESWAIKKAEH